MNRSPRDVIVLVKAAENRLKHTPDYGAMLIMQYVEDAMEEDFNGAPDAEQYGLRHLDLLMLESCFHDLTTPTVKALFDSTQGIRNALPNREMARAHWQSKLNVVLQ